MACPRFPTGKVREILERTEQTGNEHAVIMCGDGSTTDVIEGGKTGLNFGDEMEQCNLADGPIDVIHTHPNGVSRLSDQDRKVAALDDDVENVCVAVEGGEIVCESVDTCETEVPE